MNKYKLVVNIDDDQEVIRHFNSYEEAHAYFIGFATHYCGKVNSHFISIVKIC